MITAAQIRAARGLLALSQVALSGLAGVSAATVKRLETSPETRGSAASLLKIETALERAGVEFIPGDESKGPGVRLKAGHKGKSGRRTRR